MRTFLKDLNIAGAMLVSREEEILRYSVEGLLKWCDWILIMFDNESEKSRNIIAEYQEKYPDRIRISESGFPRATEEQENSLRGLFHRFKPLQGPVRETVFQYFRNCMDNGEKIGILIFIDADEVLTSYLPTLLIEFVNSDKKVIAIKPVDIFGSFKTLRGKSMAAHMRIMKYSKEITALPYRTLCRYRPFERKDGMGTMYANVHIAALFPRNREWKNYHWKPRPQHEEPLWVIDKDVRDLKPEEIKKVLAGPSNYNVKEFLENEAQ